MTNKNHIIKGFKVSDETAKDFEEAIEKTGFKNSELSRLLFNRALKELKAAAQKLGWENLQFSVKEIN